MGRLRFFATLREARWSFGGSGVGPDQVSRRTFVNDYNKRQGAKIMGFFSSGPSLKEVDRQSIAMIDQEIGSGLTSKCIDRNDFDRLLSRLERYSVDNNLGMMKTAKIMGNVEHFLSQAVSGPERHEYMKAVRSIFS